MNKMNENAKPYISLKNICKKFKIQSSLNYPDGFFYALKDINLDIMSKECIVISGANGSGKTLLMSIIAGLVKASSGTIKREKEIGLIFQDTDTQILGETPKEDIEFGLINQKIAKEVRAKKIENVLEAVCLKNKIDFPARTLSGGEKRKLATAGILAMDREIIIFDEPFANLDYNGIKQVNSLIKNLKKSGKTLIILTHELEKCLGLAERLIVLYKGQLVFDGSAENGLKEPLENWGIRNPIQTYKNLQDLIWE